MTRLTEAQARALREKSPHGVVRTPTAGDVWLSVVDKFVRLVTLGRGTVVRNPHRAPFRWDGVIRRTYAKATSVRKSADI